MAIMAEMAQVEQLMSGLQTQSSAPFSCPDKGNDLAHNVKLQVSDETLKVECDFQTQIMFFKFSNGIFILMKKSVL